MNADYTDTVPTLSYHDRRVNPHLECTPLNDNCLWTSADATRSDQTDLSIDSEFGSFDAYDNLI